MTDVQRWIEEKCQWSISELGRTASSEEAPIEEKHQLLYIEPSQIYEPVTEWDHYFLGCYYVGTRAWERAVPLFQFSAQRNHLPSVVALARILARNGEYLGEEGALVYAEQAISLGSAETYFLLGVYHQRQSKDYSRMKQCYYLVPKTRIKNVCQNLCSYYMHIKPKTKKVIFYCLLACELGDPDPAIRQILSTFLLRLLDVPSFLFAVKHGFSEVVEEYQRRGKILPAIYPALLQLRRDQLTESYQSIKDLYLANLQLHFYGRRPTYFSAFLSADIYQHVLLPLLHH